MLAAADEIGGIFERLLEPASAKDSGEARIATCLCLTIAELYIGVLTVLRSRAQSHAAVLIRSMQEALADLKNLVADPTYLDQMRFDNANQMLKTFQGFMEDPDLREDKEAQEKLGSWRAQEQTVYDELRPQGFKPLGATGKFKRAKMVGEYATGYRFLCSFSHNDLTTLKARHAGDDHLRFTDPLPRETLKSLLGMSISLYGRAVDTLPQYTTLSEVEVKAAIDAVEARWARV